MAKNEHTKNPIKNKYPPFLQATDASPIKDNHRIEKLDSKICVKLDLKF